jgi:hypothetical protein
MRDTNPFINGTPHTVWIIDTVENKGGWPTSVTRTYTTDAGFERALAKHKKNGVDVACTHVATITDERIS